MEDINVILKELKPYLNEKMQLTALPAKYKKQLIAFYYLAGKIESNRTYTEREINEILNQWTTFGDPATLRREMFNKYLLNRTDDCRSYWKEENIPSLQEFILRNI